MSYASPTELVAYAEDTGVTVPTGATVDRLLERAERDVDRVVGPRPLLADGRKFAPSLLLPVQQEALARATCAQAVHRLVLGEDYFSEAEDLLVGTDVRVLKPAQRVSVRVLEELAGTGLLTKSGTIPAPPEAA